MEAARELLTTVFKAVPDGYWVEVRPVPGEHYKVPAETPGQLNVENLESSTVYFGVLPRRDKGAVDIATVVWLDVDSDTWTPENVLPTPGAVVKSGKGTHVYWPLRRAVESGLAVRLAKLAALAYGGDRQVCEPMRVMRLPGSLNMKYDPPRPCELVLCRDVHVEPDKLEENLVAAVVAPHWEDGQRHALALATAALLHRAEWDQRRIESAIEIICRVTGDEEVRDRRTAVDSTFRQVAAGQTVSAQALREVMGDAFKELVGALGVKPTAGQILEEGVAVGHRKTAERDLAQWVTDLGQLAWYEGLVCVWEGDRWRRTSGREEAVSWVFAQLKRLTEADDNGVESPFAVTNRLATAVTSTVAGLLAVDPLPEPDPYRIPLANGILDVRTGELIAHAKENGNTWVMPISYDAGAGCPMWERFLAEAVPDTTEYLREWAGYVLMHGNPLQKMLWLYGPEGTGKSTYIDVLTSLVGHDAVMAITGGQFTAYDVASLSGKKLATCTELRQGILRTATLKSLVSGDAVPGRHPYGKPFPVRFGGKIVWASNSLPNPDEAAGLFRRLAMVGFDVVPERVVNALSKKLESELPGILNWALEGLSRVLRVIGADEPWDAPAPVTALVSSYREVANAFAMFVQEELVLSDDATTPVIEFYQRYRSWCQDRGIEATKFGPQLWQELRTLGLTTRMEKRKDGNEHRIIVGAELTPVAY